MSKSHSRSAFAALAVLGVSGVASAAYLSVDSESDTVNAAPSSATYYAPGVSTALPRSWRRR